MFKKLLFFIGLSLFTCHFTIAQNSFRNVKIADSLFSQQKYTESFNFYQTALMEDRVTSQAMLLKMAFIKEGLGDYSNALYYLNLYYLQTHNKKALRKMEDIAKEYSLYGYHYTDKEFFLNVFYRYYVQLVLLVSAMAFVLFAYFVYKRRKLHAKPLMSVIYLMITLIILLFMVNFGRSYQAGIIIKQNAYLMDGPSSGANLKEIVDKGHRVSILGREDVWIKIRWLEDVVYIRENQIREIGL